MFWPNLKTVASPTPEIIAIGIQGCLGGGCEVRTCNLWEEEAVGVGDDTVRKSVLSSHRPSIVTLPLPLRISEILLFLCSSMPLFPHPKSSLPKLPHVSL